MTTIASPEAIHVKIQDLLEEIRKVILGKDEEIKLALTAFFSRGHLLIEDVPGMGKTRLAYALARSMSLSFCRIQFTSDLLPSDILGATIFSTQDEEFVFKKGPIFSNIILADELNRTPPKTQSALLEATNERQVSIEGKTFPLPDPFFVMATQNPCEFYGTYPLPESQLDRFSLRLNLGYPSEDAERKILEDKSFLDEKPELKPCLSGEEVLKLQQIVPEVQVHERIMDYLVQIVRRSRESSKIWLGISPRGAKSYLLCCKAYAFLSARNYLIPDDVRRLLIPCCAHRITLKETGFRSDPFALFQEKEKVLKELLEEVEIPR